MRADSLEGKAFPYLSTTPKMDKTKRAFLTPNNNQEIEKEVKEGKCNTIERVFRRDTRLMCLTKNCTTETNDRKVFLFFVFFVFFILVK